MTRPVKHVTIPTYPPDCLGCGCRYVDHGEPGLACPEFMGGFSRVHRYRNTPLATNGPVSGEAVDSAERSGADSRCIPDAPAVVSAPLATDADAGGETTTTATDLGWTKNDQPQEPLTRVQPECVGGNLARFTRPMRPTYHCGEPGCACMAVPQTFAIMPQCPTHRVAKERRTIQTHSTTTGITEPMVFLVCPLCPDPFTGPSNA